MINQKLSASVFLGLLNLPILLFKSKSIPMLVNSFQSLTLVQVSSDEFELEFSELSQAERVTSPVKAGA